MSARLLPFLQYLIAGSLLLSTPLFCLGQNEPKQNAKAQKTAHELRRDWIAGQAPKIIANKAELREFLARLDNLNEFEMNELANEVLGQLEGRRKQQLNALREVNARERAVQAELQQRAAEQNQLQQVQPLQSFFPPVPPVIGFVRDPYPFYPYSPYAYPPVYFPPPVIGYFPIVTWLPTGVSMSASAVISSDRRHVRTSISPFFSGIGPVHTFNYATGEYRRLPQYDSRRPEPAPITPTYDGLRTRNDRFR
jgi:hypothetical protein